MLFLTQLPHRWVTIQVPGTYSERSFATYVGYDERPPAPADVGDFKWLRNAPRHPEDHLADASDDAVRDLSAQTVAELLGDDATIPDDFARFLDEGLRDRLRSATDSYFDLGDFIVAVEGGRLLHLISDSQWVYHWLLYLGDEGTSVVVGTMSPAGFTPDPDDPPLDSTEYVVVADSFAEFTWRWWMDNEIFYHSAVDRTSLTPNQQAYVTQYGHPTKLS
ncbi:hypothetical protein [Kribbella sindirgiensis]|uniref:Uncharacterized protein n=1 Tax=Kribbella sindirgiensis TaxID=1124744 RepID=A0A4R0JAM4_9ACTN|nr:hypothetical protein [Kribbella sindirgiensis]TCC42987.1 hypothetical protein E0H50_00375 [Kribbella sindirgiensis]